MRDEREGRVRDEKVECEDEKGGIRGQGEGGVRDERKVE